MPSEASRPTGFRENRLAAAATGGHEEPRGPATPIELPAPLGGVVNAYLIPDGRVLVDPGPVGEAAERALQRGLAAAGLALGDIRVVLCTHAHPSHAGLAHRVAEASGATVMAHRAAARGLAEGHSRGFRAFLVRAAGAGGVPDQVVRDAIDALVVAPAVQLVDELDDGQPLALGKRTWQVIGTPGHAAGHVGFLESRSGTLLGGDALLRHEDTTLPLEPRHASAAVRLDEVVATWRRLARLPIEVVWPGHGEPVRAHRVLVARRLAGVRRQLYATRDAIPPQGATLWDVVATMESEPLDARRVLPALGAAAAHLEWLVSRGVLEREERGGLARFLRLRKRPMPGATPGHRHQDPV